ncbi:TonB-dependent receptor [Chitinimonas sp. BJYL2]|uniref:TonB-dependent receptor n=1 Tax=Chitinimonas sp. BJYL2 TaxID=2976696 RepID=UPI0022B34480|nr:TonB-dependent receptor [Chitinimonas sp. BJYL2]
MTSRLTSLAAALAFAGMAAPLLADNAGIQITATRLPAKAADQAVNLTVISRDDIDRSAATTIPDLLANVAGVTVRKLDSTDNGSIDLRGFGITGPSNTLILLDGVRLNDNDLSAPKLASIPLERIERIEIIRGGSVAWGSGSTGGVINLITRRDNSTALGVRLGSNDHREFSASGHINVGQHLSLRLDGRALDTDGFRANSGHRGRNGSAELAYRDGDTRFSAGYANEQDDFRFPGARSVNPATGVNQFLNDTWGSSTLADHGETDNERFTVHGEGRIAAWRWAVDASRREKTVDSHFEDAFGGTTQAHGEVRDQRVSPRASYDFGAGLLSFGIDLGRIRASNMLDYRSPGFNYASANQSKQTVRALWADLGYALSTTTRINVGARSEHMKQTVTASGAPAVERSESPSALQLGVRQQLGSDLSLFARLGQSYRLPNADELVDNAQLAPQRGRDIEAGLDAKLGGGTLRLSAFNLRLTNEIAYQPFAGPFGFGQNINLQPTRREGLSADWSQAFGDLDYGINATLQQAEFRSGAYGAGDLNGKRVPLVPKTLLNLRAGYTFTSATRLDASVHAVGDARLDNDQTNTGPKLPGYATVDIKLSHRWQDWQFALAGRNLGDKRYASYGIRSTFGPNYNLYPEPGRRWFASADYRF